MANKKAITTREQDYSQWYLDIIDAAELAENSAVRGCMVIRPYGYAIWENYQKILDKMIKETGHQNAYFPMFIPKSFLSREAAHVEGFAKECAVVTHHRLKAENGGVVVDPESKLTEELIVRPTSETIIYDTYSRWISSYRDLPVLVNQWANIVRWEMRTRPFLRTSEFLWQEGHTAHASYEEAEEEVNKMLNVYKKLAEDYFAIPVFVGRKSESEKFAGALHTYTVETMTQDGKALQAGTSHNLGQNFAKAFDVKYTDKNGIIQYVWQTSWGVSTRFIGAIIMAHSDDKGLVLPPKIAPIKAVIVPIWKDEDGKKIVLEAVAKMKAELDSVIEGVKVDDRDYLTPGERFYEWEKKGVPVRIEVGPRDLASNQVTLVRRDDGSKNVVSIEVVKEEVQRYLKEIQISVYNKALEFRKANTHEIDDYDHFKKQMEAKIPGFVLAPWCGDAECEDRIKEETKASTRCMPFDQGGFHGKCIKCGKETDKRIIFAKSY